MKKLIILIALFTFQSRADVQENQEIVLQLRENMLHYYEMGTAIKRKYNTQEMDDLKACVDVYHPLRDQAKKDEEIARSLKTIFYRSNLLMLTWDAYSCLYCSGDQSSCEEMPEKILELDRALKTDGYL